MVARNDAIGLDAARPAVLSTTVPRSKTRKHPCGRVAAVLWLIAVVVMIPAKAFGVAEATVEREDIYTNETIRLIIESTEPNGADPDVSGLTRDFHVTAGNTSTRTKIVNGAQFSLTRWSYLLTPKQAGEFMLPAIVVRGELTVPILIRVSDLPDEIKRQNAEHAIIELSVVGDEPEAYVQQQVILSVKMLYDDAVTSGEASPIVADNAVVERFRDEQNYTEERDGRQYHVFEQRFVLSAELSGELTIAPLVFSGTLSTSTGGNREFDSAFEERVRRMLEGTPLENDPFFMQENFNLDRSNTGRPFAVESDPLTLTIKPRPAEVDTAHWLPAQNVELIDSWAEGVPDVRAGQPVQRSIIVRTKGLVASQIPELKLEKPVGARMYVEPRSATTPTDSRSINGQREHLITYIADAEGQLVVPVTAIDWWDVKQDRAAVSEIEAIVIDVLPSPTNAVTDSKDASQTAPIAGTGTLPTSIDGDDALKNETSTAQSPLDEGETKGSSAWLDRLRDVVASGVGSPILWIVFAIGLAVLSWITLIRRATRRESSAPSAATGAVGQAGINQGLASLKRRLDAGDAAGASRALLGLAKHRWPTAPPRSLAALAQRLHAQGEDGAAVEQLERHLFAGDGSPWSDDVLRKLLDANLWRPSSRRQQRRSTVGLAPLYPNQPLPR